MSSSAHDRGHRPRRNSTRFCAVFATPPSSPTPWA